MCSRRLQQSLLAGAIGAALAPLQFKVRDLVICDRQVGHVALIAVVVNVATCPCRAGSDADRARNVRSGAAINRKVYTTNNLLRRRLINSVRSQTVPGGCYIKEKPSVLICRGTFE